MKVSISILINFLDSRGFRLKVDDMISAVCPIYCFLTFSSLDHCFIAHAHLGFIATIFIRSVKLFNPVGEEVALQVSGVITT